MKSKTLVAIGSALLLVAGVFTMGAGTASATDSNHVDYWQALYPNAVSCYKYDGNGGAYGTVTNGGDAVTLNPFQQAWPGNRWEVLIVKGGSVDTGNGPGNAVYPLPIAGTPYFAPLNHGGQQAGVSHWIVCTGQTSQQPKVATAAISFIAPTCDKDQKLVLGSVTNATWGTVVYTGTDSRGFSVTATAVGVAKFAGGDSTKTFTGTLLAATGGCTPPPCLPKSAVSYTYNAATNSGIITVASMGGYSAELCNSFWVTAASWTFVGNTVWPQTLDQWKPANAGNRIHTVGTYPYAAIVACGQGDIYATFTAPGVPTPTAGVLNGPSNPYQEHFLHQMGFTGPQPTYTVQSAAACPTVVIASIPEVSFTDQCGTANDSVTVPTQMGVTYTKVDSRNSSGVGMVTVTAAAAKGYVFGGGVTKTSWSHDFTNQACLTVQPIAPNAIDQVCTSDGNQESSTKGYIQLGLKANLHYTIDGHLAASARNYLDPGTYTVGVIADPGYNLIGPASWEMTINPSFCPPTFALLSTTASMSNITCTTHGSYTLANTEGVQWFVNGSTTPTAPGTYQVSGVPTVNVQASLVNSITDGWEEGAQTAWTFNFTNPDNCLPTLAFTGSSGMTLGLLLGLGLLLFGGGAIVFTRTFRANAK